MGFGGSTRLSGLFADDRALAEWFGRRLPRSPGWGTAVAHSPRWRKDTQELG